MKIIKIDKKENEIQCIPETPEDLWHLEKIISKKDIRIHDYRLPKTNP